MENWYKLDKLINYNFNNINNLNKRIKRIDDK